MEEGIRPHSLDHVALWLPERDALADFLCDHLGMHVIERTDAFTLVGVDAKLGKLTLFAAEGPRRVRMLGAIRARAECLYQQRAPAAKGSRFSPDISHYLGTIEQIARWFAWVFAGMHPRGVG